MQSFSFYMFQFLFRSVALKSHLLLDVTKSSHKSYKKYFEIDNCIEKHQ